MPKKAEILCLEKTPTDNFQTFYFTNIKNILS